MRYVFSLIEMENKPVDKRNNENTITDELVIADHFYWVYLAWAKQV